MKFAVWLSGGKPISITTNTVASGFDYQGLILSGGLDINPTRYGKPKKIGYHYLDDLDQLELSHLARADAENIPVLGICRGCQLINVHRKGTLHLDITKAYEKAKYPTNVLGYIFFRKKIKIKTNSQLFQIINKLDVRVNSIHRQSIEELGYGLKITAFEHNQIIQGIEDPSKPFFLGVQFHPEFLIYQRCFRNIFKALIAHTR